jgi:hypothetical protein
MSRDDLTREGEIGEMKVQLHLTQQGGVVSVPLTASTNGYDLLCDIGDRILKIQVKSVKKNDNNTVLVPLKNRKNASVAKNNRGQSHSYKDLVDYIAVAIKKDSRIYYIDTSSITSEKDAETFLLPEYEGRSKKRKLTSLEEKIIN